MKSVRKRDEDEFTTKNKETPRMDGKQNRREGGVEEKIDLYEMTKKYTSPEAPFFYCFHQRHIQMNSSLLNFISLISGT